MCSALALSVRIKPPSAPLIVHFCTYVVELSELSFLELVKCVRVPLLHLAQTHVTDPVAHLPDV